MKCEASSKWVIGDVINGDVLSSEVISSGRAHKKETKRYLRLHLRTETVGLLRFRPDPVRLASPQLEAAFRLFS